MIILGIETSCDETSLALLEARGGRLVLQKNLIFSQIKTHAKYGGVVPEMAARAHVEKIMPMLKDAMRGKNKPDVIAVTAGPGLATALLVGVETARTLAYLWEKPLVAVNHLEGHIYANWLPPICHSGLDPESSKFLDSRFRGNDRVIPRPLPDNLRRTHGISDNEKTFEI